MAHYAFLDENNIVVEVIRGNEETDTSHDWEQYYSELCGLRCLRTSINNRIRGNYAGIGYSYDEELDAFLAPKPYPSWILNDEFQWEAPVPHPTDIRQLGETGYSWNETKQNWVLEDES